MKHLAEALSLHKIDMRRIVDVFALCIEYRDAQCAARAGQRGAKADCQRKAEQLADYVPQLIDLISALAAENARLDKLVNGNSDTAI